MTTENNDNSTTPIPPIQSDSGIKEYRCPHCGKLLFKGNVKRLSMVCHHCQKMIDADDSELFGHEISEE